MYRVLTLSASCALILCIVSWIIAIAAFVASLFLWYKTGDYSKFLLVDYVSENLQRAPRWMTDNSLEWLGRLVIEPKRLWQRYIIGNPLFLYRIIRSETKLPDH